jgi:hypothetical protein
MKMYQKCMKYVCDDMFSRGLPFAGIITNKYIFFLGQNPHLLASLRRGIYFSPSDSNKFRETHDVMHDPKP